MVVHVVARLAGTPAGHEGVAVQVQRVHRVGQAAARVGVGVARHAVREGLLGGIAKEDEAVVGGQAHEGVLKRVAARAPTMVGVEVGVVVAHRVGRHGLDEKAVAVDIARRGLGLGVRLVFWRLLVELRERRDTVDEASLGGKAACLGKRIGTGRRLLFDAPGLRPKTGPAPACERSRRHRPSSSTMGWRRWA